jgi:signal transduction histidine kinase
VVAGGEVALDVVAEPALPLVAGDPTRTRQVLTNLVDNAVKYSPEGGRIEVSVVTGEETVRFEVRDEGLGIPADEQERIFEKFYRLDAGMLRGVGGSGLGLYICRELVTQMHGRLWVVSEPGEGSTFAFELPAAARAEHATESRVAS